MRSIKLFVLSGSSKASHIFSNAVFCQSSVSASPGITIPLSPTVFCNAAKSFVMTSVFVNAASKAVKQNVSLNLHGYNQMVLCFQKLASVFLSTHPWLITEVGYISLYTSSLSRISLSSSG